MSVTEEDRAAAARFFRDERTGLSVKFNLGLEPSPLLDMLAAHRIAAFKAGMEHAERIWRSVQYSPAPYTDGKAKLAQAIRDASDGGEG